MRDSYRVMQSWSGTVPNTFLYRILPPAERMAPVIVDEGARTPYQSEASKRQAAVKPLTAGHLYIWAQVIAMLSARTRHCRNTNAITRLPQDRARSWSGEMTGGRPPSQYKPISDTSSTPQAAARRREIAVDSHFALSGGTQMATPSGRPYRVSPPSASGYHHFSLAATAPPGTTTATVILLATDTTAWVDDVSLQVAVGGTDLETLP